MKIDCAKKLSLKAQKKASGVLEDSAADLKTGVSC